MAKKISIDLEAGTAQFISGMDKAAGALDNVNHHAGTAREMLSRFTEGLGVGTGAEVAEKGLDLVTEAFSSVVEGTELAIEKISEWTEEAIESAQRTAQLATSLGFSVETIQAVTNEAKKLGLDGAAVSSSLSHLSEKITQLAENGGHAADALAKYGVNVRELATLAPDEQLRRVADAMRDAGTGGERATIAAELLGKAGKSMAGAFSEGSSAIDRWIESGKEAGTVLSGLDVGRLQAAKAASDELAERWEGMKNQIALALAPAIAGVSQIIADMAPNAETMGEALTGALKNSILYAAYATESMVNLSDAVMSLGQNKPVDLVGPTLKMLDALQKESDVTAKQFSTHMEEMRHAASSGIANTDAEKFARVLKELNDQIDQHVHHLDRYQIALRGAHLTMQQAGELDSKRNQLAQAEAAEKAAKAAEEAAKKQEERLDREMEAYNRLIDGPMAKYKEQLKALNDLAAHGKIDKHQYAQALAKLDEDQQNKDSRHDREKHVEAVTRRFSFDMLPQHQTDPKTAMVQKQTELLNKWDQYVQQMWDKIVNGNGGTGSQDQTVSIS